MRLRSERIVVDLNASKESKGANRGGKDVAEMWLEKQK
jgi:hypothetical protein